MSIDYSDMAFPKLACKKKGNHIKKSILKSRKGVCYLCSILYDDPSKKYTEEHHIMFGSGQRELSEADGPRWICVGIITKKDQKQSTITEKCGNYSAE